MKITESRIRQHIRQLLMETLNIGPDGIAIPNAVFRSQNPQIASKLPEDVPPIDRSFPAKLARAAKKEFENIQQNEPETFNLIKQRALPMAFGHAYNDLLDNLTFTQSDLKYINIDIKSALDSNRENYNQSMELLDTLIPKTAAYLRHIAIATDDFSRDESGAMWTTLSPNTRHIFGLDFFTLFFSPPDNPDDIGMGASLIDLIFEKIMSAIVSVQSQTPIEFADQLYPEFERDINIHFQKNPIIANNIEFSSGNELELEKIRKGYLDSIRYVLIELIAELNFDFLYYGEGTKINSSDPNQLLLFLPDDRFLLKKSSEAAKYILHAWRGDSSEGFKYFLGDFYRPKSWTQSNVPVELRSIPSYYDIKFSVNPNFLSIIDRKAQLGFKNRLFYNLKEEKGFKKEGIKIPDEFDWGEIAELWEES